MNLFLILILALAWLAILVGGSLGWQLLRQNGRLLLRVEDLEKRLDEIEFGEPDAPTGLALGSLTPEFELPDLAGETWTLAQLRGQPLLLIFFNPACGYCREMVPKLAEIARMGSTGHWPVPPGDPPGGTAELRNAGSVIQNIDAAIPFGGPPNGTGGSPVLPSILIITAGDVEANRRLFDEHKLSCPVLLQKESEVATAYQANGTPSGYLIGPEGKIASELTIGADALLALAAEPRSSRREEAHSSVPQPWTLNSPPGNQSLVTSATTNRLGNRSLARSKIKRDGLKAGTPAPDFRLPRLDGHGDLSLEEFRGRRVLLVFSSPHCGPCDALAPELEKFYRQQLERDRSPVAALANRDGAQKLDQTDPFEAAADGDRPRSDRVAVVMITKGEPKENRAKVKKHGLTFPIVLQQQWEISRRYAKFATPVAYLIDEAGVIAADVAVGVEPILALLSDATSPHQEREPAMRRTDPSEDYQVSLEKASISTGGNRGNPIVA